MRSRPGPWRRWLDRGGDHGRLDQATAAGPDPGPRCAAPGRGGTLRGGGATSDQSMGRHRPGAPGHLTGRLAAGPAWQRLDQRGHHPAARRAGVALAGAAGAGTRRAVQLRLAVKPGRLRRAQRRPDPAAVPATTAGRGPRDQDGPVRALQSGGAVRAGPRAGPGWRQRLRRRPCRRPPPEHLGVPRRPARPAQDPAGNPVAWELADGPHPRPHPVRDATHGDGWDQAARGGHLVAVTGRCGRTAAVAAGGGGAGYGFGQGAGPARTVVAAIRGGGGRRGRAARVAVLAAAGRPGCGGGWRAPPGADRQSSRRRLKPGGKASAGKLAATS